MVIGSNLLRLRKQAGYTQETLADAAELEMKTVQRIESQQVNPKLATLSRLRECLDIEWNELLQGL